MFCRTTVRIFFFVQLLGLFQATGTAKVETSAKQRQILVFGGNGFMGASAVEKLVQKGDKVTIVNRGNWYWDSKERIKPHVNFISCDRKNNVTSCADLVQLINDLGTGNRRICNGSWFQMEGPTTEKARRCLIAVVERGTKSSPAEEERNRFDAVIDFSSYGPKETQDSTTLLRNKAYLYVHISTDSVYDVCDIQQRDVPLKEEQAVRPEDPYRRDLLNSHHDYGNRKLQAEEALIKQRSEVEGGIPYVILRLPDVIGPRDTTYRFWIYQLWIRLMSMLPKQPVIIPKYLVDYKISFVYVDDVAQAIMDILEPSKRDAVSDQVFNLAWPETVTLPQLLRDIEAELGIEKNNFQADNDSSNVYFYPSGRTAPIDPSRAEKAFGWKPTPWKEAISKTVQFYEAAMANGKFNTQRDEIIQIQAMQFYSEDKLQFYDTLEKAYNINISHFKPHDEL